MPDCAYTHVVRPLLDGPFGFFQRAHRQANDCIRADHLPGQSERGVRLTDVYTSRACDQQARLDVMMYAPAARWTSIRSLMRTGTLYCCQRLVSLSRL